MSRVYHSLSCQFNNVFASVDQYNSLDTLCQTKLVVKNIPDSSYVYFGATSIKYNVLGLLNASLQLAFNVSLSDTSWALKFPFHTIDNEVRCLMIGA